MPHERTRYEIERMHRRIAQAKEQLGGKCVVCGDTEGLDFDHIDPRTKLFTVVQGWSKAGFWDEVAKCQLLCKPHHKEKTKVESQARQGVMQHGRWCYLKTTYKCRCAVCRADYRIYRRERYLASKPDPGWSDGRADETLDLGTDAGSIPAPGAMWKPPRWFESGWGCSTPWQHDRSCVHGDLSRLTVENPVRFWPWGHGGLAESG